MDVKQSGDESDRYKGVLKTALEPQLNVMLKMVVVTMPADPINFIGKHLRHLHKVDNVIKATDCAECEDLLSKVKTPSSLSSGVNSAQATPRLIAKVRNQLAPADQAIISSIEGQNWFQVDHWRKINIIDCWADLTKKQGQALKWWHVAAAMRSKRAPQLKQIKDRKTWKTIRVFVSSTFRDMFCEREWLIKRVFPDLRAWCAERKLFLVECDLRWGVPKDSTSREILAACLNELDRCRDENTMAYFVGLLGERYGWVPSEKDFPDDLRRQYCWVPGMSVTTLEMLCGALWDNNPNAIIMLRNDDFHTQTDALVANAGIDAETKAAVLGQYRESDAAANQSLEALKTLVQRTLPAEQVCSYGTVVEQVMGDGSNRISIGGLQEFGGRVLGHLKRAIERQFVSVSAEQLSQFEIQHGEHEQFMTQRSRALFGRESETEAILSHVSSSSNSDVPTLVVSGSAGTGKSSLIANLAKTLQADANYRVVLHFVGATAASTSLYQLLRRMWYECTDAADDAIPTDFDELRRSFEPMLRRASSQAASSSSSGSGSGTEQKQKQTLVVFIDALNQLDDDGDTLELVWLPKVVPHNVRLVVSTLEGTTLDALRSHTHKLPEVKVEALTVEWRKKLVVKYLEEYNKKLSDGQVEKLLSQAESGRPLWLTLACEELRVFGTFEQLEWKIETMAKTAALGGLIEHILERVMGETVAGGDLMQAALSLIGISRFGLTESELQELLVMEPTIPGFGKLGCVKTEHEAFGKEISRLPMQTWAVLNLDLRQFLRPLSSSGDSRLDYYHRSISKVVKSMMFKPDMIEPEEEKPQRQFRGIRIYREEPPPKNAENFWHSRIAAYFSSKKGSYRRKAEELPVHLMALKDKSLLFDLVYHPLVFDILYKEDTKAQLLSYLRFLDNDYTSTAQRFHERMKESWTKMLSGSKITHDDREYEKLNYIGRIQDFATKVKGFSSQYEKDSWKRIIGSGNVFPSYELSENAWGCKKGGSKEFVELQFEEPIFIFGVAIYETYNAGAVTKICIRNPSNKWDTVYVGKPELIRYSRIFCPPIQVPQYKSDSVRIEIDASVCNDIVQIDAVKLIGATTVEENEEYRKSYEESERNRTKLFDFEDSPLAKPAGLIKQWVKEVLSFSAQASELKGAASRIIGRYRTYPEMDGEKAWSPKEIESRSFEETAATEFIEVAVETPVYLWQLVIYETLNAGGIERILVRDSANEWHEIYKAEVVQQIRMARKFRPILNRPEFKTKAIRIEVQVTTNRTIHIDAVKVYGFQELADFKRFVQSESADFELTGAVIQQYPINVLNVSSEHSSTPSYDILGPSRVPYVEGPVRGEVWSPRWFDVKEPTEQFIELEYAKSVYVTSVAIFEMCTVGGITKISARDPDGNWVPMYEGVAKHISIRGVCGRMFTPMLTPPAFATNAIRLDLITNPNPREYEFVAISSVALYGTEKPNERSDFSEVSKRIRANQALRKSQTPEVSSSFNEPILKQWVSSIMEYTCDAGDETPMHIMGPPEHYPLYGHNPEWTPPQGSTKYSFEFTYDTPVYLAAIEVYENFHAGGVKRIEARKAEGEWDEVYKAESIQDIVQSRKFVPKIVRPTYKASEFRIEISHEEAAPEWVEIDGICLVGCENERPPDDFVEQLMRDSGDNEDDESDEKKELIEEKISKYMERCWQMEYVYKNYSTLLNNSVARFEKWLGISVKMGWFLIDLGDFETAEKQLNDVALVIQLREDVQGFRRNTAYINRKKGEIYHALVVLYRTLTTNFTSKTLAVAKRSRNLGQETSLTCYEVNSHCWPKDDLRFGEIAAACAYFVPEFRDKTIALFEKKGYTRGLVDLYALKGTENQAGEAAVMRDYHEKSVKLAHSEFGDLHLQTARAHQLYGQTLLNRHALIKEEKTTAQLEEAYKHYSVELQILEKLFGENNPIARRSREDNITVLSKLGKNDLVATLREKQKAD